MVSGWEDRGRSFDLGGVGCIGSNLIKNLQIWRGFFCFFSRKQIRWIRRYLHISPRTPSSTSVQPPCPPRPNPSSYILYTLKQTFHPLILILILSNNHVKLAYSLFSLSKSKSKNPLVFHSSTNISGLLLLLLVAKNSFCM